MENLVIDCFAGGGGASKGIEMALNRPIGHQDAQGKSPRYASSYRGYF